MPDQKKCSQCGADLPEDSPAGQCVPCLLRLGIAALAINPSEPPADGPPIPAGGDEEDTPRVANYRILQQIGQGGCGVVYLAEQLHPLRRQVALKVIKAGMDTRQVIARFQTERQTLALMDHPSIAKVFDAGAAENGRPYFAMELVRGVRITDYCDQHKLNTRQRVTLFIQVCQAIQHAHQKGVIHRDIKPSNILIADQDGVPLPKIIDFGIAKATTGELLGDQTYFTSFQQFVGTPAYMSPEQAGLGNLDIDTRSDIYSLGVLLYELLTGQSPFDTDELRRSALAEVLRIICEKEPPRPSARLTTLTSQQLSNVADRRGIEPSKLHTLLRGDLDWILMRTLEKDRTRRYETANGLAQDLQRHLDNEPVLARKPSRRYRLRKMVRRNRLLVSAAAIVALALMLGCAASTWMYFKEKAAQKEARTQATLVEARDVAYEALKQSDEFTRRAHSAKPAGSGSNAFDPLRLELVGDYNYKVQEILEEELGKACQDMNTVSALAIVVDPGSGDLLGLANHPRLTQNDIDPTVNSLVEPGSLINFIVAAGAISDGVVDMNTKFDCEQGHFSHDGVTVMDHEPYGELSVEDILRVQSNIGSLKLARTLGVAKLHDYLRRFGFGERAGIHLAEEAAGVVPLISRGDKQSNLSMSNGQKLATPMQLAMAMAAIANGGKLMAPRVVLSVLDEGGVEITTYPPEIVRQVITPQSAAKIRLALGGVANGKGVAPAAAVRGFSVGGALGNFHSEADRVNSNRFHCFFAGFMPVEDPQIVYLVRLVRSQPGWAGQVAAPVFSRIAERVAARLKLNEKALRHPEKGFALRKQAQAQDEAEQRREAHAAEAGNVEDLNDQAWILATSPDSGIRNGLRAVVYAERAVTATNRKDEDKLDTLAAAYAETLQFEKAVGTQMEALALVTNDGEIKEEFTARLKLYEARMPYRAGN